MPLPELIEIVPLTSPVRAEITVPGSKSITNRALILAALTAGRTTLRGALWSEDTQVMTECLRALGFSVDVQPDPAETCNRTITVDGLGGRIPNAGTAERPLELFVGNAGTAARFLAAMVCLGGGAYCLSGVPRMHERPQAALFAALRELGYHVDSPNDKLPATIFGSRRGNEAEGLSAERVRLLTSAATPTRCSVSVVDSSQFASALLLASGVGGWEVEVTGANEDEMPYVNMTRELVKAFPKHGGEFQIEPDASSGSYFWAAGSLREFEGTQKQKLPRLGGGVDAWWNEAKNLMFSLTASMTTSESVAVGPSVKVANWPTSGWQIDEKFPHTFVDLALSGVGLVEWESEADFAKKHGTGWRERWREISFEISNPPLVISRSKDLGDSIMTAVILAPFSVRPDNFTDLGRLRVQECERVVALRTELTKCGAKLVEEGDTLTVHPSALHGAEIETYHDHRMAMCFAVLGLKVPGIKIKDPACVKKTFPNFFQKLATPPPHGLGVTILDGHTGRPLGLDELFAD